MTIANGSTIAEESQHEWGIDRTSMLTVSPSRILCKNLWSSHSLVVSRCARRHSSSIVDMVAPAGLFSNRYKLDEIPDLTGKVAVVTGGSRGIGEAVTSALVQKGCKGELLPDSH